VEDFKSHSVKFLVAVGNKSMSISLHITNENILRIIKIKQQRFYEVFHMARIN